MPPATEIRKTRSRRRTLNPFLALFIGSLTGLLLSATPALRTHPLPPQLARLPNQPSNSYAPQIEPGPQGHWIWTQFPITIWIDPGPSKPNQPDPRRQTWVNATETAIADWSPYLPLKRDDRPSANIWIHRKRPPLQRINGKIAPARNAETRPEILPNTTRPQLRQHIYLSDSQGPQALQGTARHELGHALGLWGHSLDPKDVMYPSQGVNPVGISDRDRQTLRWVYQQGTRFGSGEWGIGSKGIGQ